MGGLFVGKNIYNGEHVAIKLVSPYFHRADLCLFVIVHLIADHWMTASDQCLCDDVFSVMWLDCMGGPSDISQNNIQQTSWSSGRPFRDTIGIQLRNSLGQGVLEVGPPHQNGRSLSYYFMVS